MARETTVWIYQETNKRNLTRKDLNMIKKEKPRERKEITSVGNVMIEMKRLII